MGLNILGGIYVEIIIQPYWYIKSYICIIVVQEQFGYDPKIYNMPTYYMAIMGQVWGRLSYKINRAHSTAIKSVLIFMGRNIDTEVLNCSIPGRIDNVKSIYLGTRYVCHIIRTLKISYCPVLPHHTLKGPYQGLHRTIGRYPIK